MSAQEETTLQQVLESIMMRIQSIECTLGYIIKQVDIKPPDVKLESIKKSSQAKYKYVATFCLCPNGGSGCAKPQKKEVYFGAKGYKDYTIGASDSDKLNYIARHQVNENWEDPLTAGALSRWILWGPTTSLEDNIKLFKERFGV